MRVLVKDVSNNTLMISEISRVFTSDNNTIQFQKDNGEEVKYEFAGVLCLEGADGSTSYVVMSPRSTDDSLKELLENGYLNLKSWGDETFLHPDETDIPRLEKLHKDCVETFKLHAF